MVTRTYASKSTQTWLEEIERQEGEVDNGADGETDEGDEDEAVVNQKLEEIHSRAVITTCPVCLDEFSGSKIMFLSRCSHAVCGACLDRLNFTSTSLRATVSCPSCRQTCKRTDFIKVVFPTAGTLISDERQTLTNTFKNLRRKELPDVIAKLTYIIDLEAQRSSELTLPPTVNRSMLERYTRIYSGALTSLMLRKHIKELVKKINAIDRLLIKVLRYIRTPSEDLIFDVSNYIAKMIVKELKKKKKLCDVCTPRPI